MKVNIASNGWIGKNLLKKLKILLLVLTALSFLSINTKAAVYTANLKGQFNDQNIWVPEYPGNIIGETDTVIIHNDIKLNTDIVVKGTMFIKRNGSLMGNKKVIVLEPGSFVNFGISVMDALTNQGMVFNKHILEVTKDFINSGELINQESMVVGNIIDNTGLITGNGGNLMANKKFVNSQTGAIKGNIDVCSNRFMNVDGGSLDSTRISFCGHRIFSNVFLSANIQKERIVLSLNNVQNKDYQHYQVERSVDGINFETIGAITKEDLPDEEAATIKFEDPQVLNSNSVFYRMKVTTADNKETLIPPVEVGKALSTNNSN